jgi:hypothetical protein
VAGSEWQTFKGHLARQLRFIERSCEVYDEGNTDEAIQIAIRIRVILHPGGKKSRSLLQHLNSGRISLLTTSEGAPERSDLLQYDGLGSLRVSSDGKTVSAEYGPGEDNTLHREYIKADRWWKQNVLFAEGTPYSRRDIVLGVAEQEGGAHVAAAPTAEFEKLMTPGLLWDMVEVADGVETITPLRDIRFKYVRQMAYELLNSPELLKLAGYRPSRPSKPETQPADDEGDEEAQDVPEIPDEHEADEHREPEAQRPQLERVRLGKEDLEQLREEVIRYFTAYYAELRTELEKRDPECKLDYLRGQRQLLVELGNDGVVIMHWPIEGDEDTFTFNIVKDKTVRQLCDMKALKTPSGITKKLHFDYALGEDFGHNTYLGPLVHKEGDTYYRTSWVQLDYASLAHLDRWRDDVRAKEDVRQDLDIRLTGVY